MPFEQILNGTETLDKIRAVKIGYPCGEDRKRVELVNGRDVVAQVKNCIT